MENYANNVLVFDGKEYQITGAGLYNLSKILPIDSNWLKEAIEECAVFYRAKFDDVKFLCLLTRLKSYDTIVENKLYLINRLIDETKAKILSVHNFLVLGGTDLSRLCDSLWRWDMVFYLDNVVATYFGKIAFKSECFSINGHYYPNSAKYAVRRCADCGSLYFTRKRVDGNYVNDNDVGCDEWCPDCAIDHGYRRCDDCGEWVDEDDIYYIDSSDRYVCSDCYDSYVECPNCGTVIHRDDAICTDDGEYYCCEDCAYDAGYHWDSDSEEYTRRSRIIGDYHSHDYCPIDTKCDARKKHGLYIGMENEQEATDSDILYDEDFFDKLSSILKERCFYEHDGSLNCGFELITQPLAEHDFFSTDWKNAYEHLRNNGFLSHNTDTSGLHFHFSSWYLGYTRKQKRDSVRKIFRFFHDYWRDLAKFSRRENYHYCKEIDFVTDKDTSFDRLAHDRYYAVIATNLGKNRKDTIEIRICRGTLKHETMLASADFFLHIVRNAKKVPWKDIDNLNLWFKGIKNENTINYIKSRNCFEGAF